MKILLNRQGEQLLLMADVPDDGTLLLTADV